MRLFPLTIRFWIIASSFVCVSGWLLSLLHQLTLAGYVAAFVLFGAVILPCLRRLGPNAANSRVRELTVFRNRFRHALPLMFLCILLLAFIGGVLHPPSNYDGLTYRTPRMLHWLAEGQWHWIHTQSERMNVRACNYEWLATPLLVFSKSDRGFFLINAASFALLPGLIFSTAHRLGVRKRVAWHWMWILPAGYNFALQAGGIGNDTFAAVFALASVDFALRARSTGRVSDVMTSILAAGLLSGSKASNLPLLLPWFVAILPSWRLLLSRPITSAMVGLISACCSFLPSAILNHIRCGDWTGLALEADNVDMKQPLVGIMGNSLLLLMQNLAPPVFPMAGAWNAAAPELWPESIFRSMQNNFEPGFWQLGEIPIEDSAGLGFGVSALLLLSLAWSLARMRSPITVRNSNAAYFDRIGLSRFSRVALWSAPFVALIALMGKSGMSVPGRIISPYYALLAIPLLLPLGHNWLVRRTWWKWLATGVLMLTALIVVITPPRPLWPARSLLGRLRESHPQNRLLQRAQSVYEVYANRSDSLAPLHALLPLELEVIGYVGSSNDPETSLWKPFGRRRIEWVLSQDSAERLRHRSISYLVISRVALEAHHNQTIGEWLAHYDAELVARTNITVRVSQGPVEWFIVRVKATPGSNR